MRATLGPRAGLPTAIERGAVDADESAPAARENVGPRPKRPIDPDRHLIGRRVIDERMLHDAAVLEADVDHRAPREEQMSGSSADSVPCGHAIELAVDHMSRDVVDDGGNLDRADAVGGGRLEYDVGMIQIECAPLVSHHQLRVDEEVDAAFAVAEQIEISATALDQREARIVGLHAGDGHKKRRAR
jgi:hypothetical protein